MAIQLVGFSSSGDPSRLWAALAFAVVILWGLDRSVMYGIILRLEAEQEAGNASAVQRSSH